MQEKVRNKLFFANIDSKTARIRQTKPKPCKIGQIRQKLAVRQKYFLPARRLSNPPEFCKSGGENRHLATLLNTMQLEVKPFFPATYFKCIKQYFTVRWR
jgi:hypothetical protein